MILDILDLLRCPHCRQGLRPIGRAVGCPTGHRFDPARQGHLNLLVGAAGATADTASMVADRVDFLAAGHYAPIADLVAEAATGPVVVEAGAGPGYYLRAVVDALGPDARGVATDLSAYACRRSAKLPRIGAVVADTWAGLPLRDAVADTVLAVFAPRNFAEFARICTPSGRVLVITPLAHHLAEVRQVRGLLEIEEGKHDRLLAGAEPWLEHEGGRELTYRATLPPADIARLVGMGPAAFHPDRLPAPMTPDAEPVTTTIAVRLDRFRPLTGTCRRVPAGQPPPARSS